MNDIKLKDMIVQIHREPPLKSVEALPWIGEIQLKSGTPDIVKGMIEKTTERLRKEGTTILW